MIIPFNSINKQNNYLKEDILKIIEDSIDDSSFIGGSHLKSFESNFKKLTKSKHCISVANGTDAIYISLKYLNLSPGDEVIIPTDTWISTAEAVTQNGANVVFADIDNYNTICYDSIIKKLSKRTKAIIAVHLYGQSADIKKIQSLCQKENICLIEDSAQAHMTYVDDTHVGNFGLAGTFSFFPSKNLGALGDAGCIITNDNKFADFARKFANHGSLVKHQHEFSGINSRLDTIQARILSLKLIYLKNWIEKKIKISKKYFLELKDEREIKLPVLRPNTEHSFHQFVIEVDSAQKLAVFLKKNGIGYGIHYPLPLPLTQAYIKKSTDYELEYPNSSQRVGKIISLPIYPELTNKELNYIINTLKNYNK